MISHRFSNDFVLALPYEKFHVSVKELPRKDGSICGKSYWMISTRAVLISSESIILNSL